MEVHKMGVWNKIVISIAKLLLNWSANLLFNYIDSDNNGEISKQEINIVITKLKKAVKK